MVLKPFAHIARQSLAKAVAHGYAQSVVAASQSTYASSNALNQFASPSKLSRNQLQNAFSNASSSSGTGAKASHGSANSGDLGLATYLAAWQQAQQTGDDSERNQFRSNGLVSWKPSGEDLDAIPDKADSRAPHPTKAAANEDVGAQVEEAVAREIQSQVDQELAKEAADSFDDDVAPKISQEAQAASDHIVWLAKSQEFSEVPVAFESLLQDGLTPTVEAYNALLAAAIKIHPRVVHAIPKALDVYSDMLHRRVIPDEDTYEVLVQLLVTRAHDIINAKEVLEKERIRYGSMEQPGKFMLQSKELERDILLEDHSLSIAVKLFTTATTRHSRLVFPVDLYRDLITACAREGKIEEMIRIYAHMESGNATPHAAIFPAMIEAFGVTGDLRSAVECYNEYRSLAISDDNGLFSIVQRLDGEVYASLTRAYLSCGKTDGAERFFARIRTSFDDVQENREGRMAAVETVVVQQAFIQHLMDSGEYHKALEQAKAELQDQPRDQVISQICIAAADAGDLTTASKAYDSLSTSPDTRQNPAMSLLALHAREGNLSAAHSLWMMLNAVGQATPEMVQPTVMYGVALLKSSKVEEGLHKARAMFARIRDASTTKPTVTTTSTSDTNATISEQVTEAIHLFGHVIMQNSTVLSPQGALLILWTMAENGGFVYPLAEYALASLGPNAISQLSLDDLHLALRAQASLLANGNVLNDVVYPLRFAHMLDLALLAGRPLDPFATHLVNQAITAVVNIRPDLVQRWHDHQKAAATHATLADYPSPLSMAETPATHAPGNPNPHVNPETFDPHAHTTDVGESAAIAADLEKNSANIEAQLNRSLIRLESMRTAGFHPRYITYAKMINAASKIGRMDLVHNIYALAQRDVPLDMTSKAVKHGWVPILDAMLAAYLTAGDRKMADHFHEQMLGIGSAPSANTFGLYITTLKDSTKTSDEATEALNIFRRAVAEGVEPTSFLYNAVIGKLSKARRIDDCLAYFAEMRAKNVRATSVTYGTIVNALCRVNDEYFAEQMFEEMESMSNYNPRAAPYNSMMQYFLNIKQDRSKVQAYYERMLSRNIRPTTHTYKLLIDAYASIYPGDMIAAENLLASMQAQGVQPESVHYASLIHGKGCAQRDLDGARAVFNTAIADHRVRVQPILYQALFEAMVANSRVKETEPFLPMMKRHKIEMSAYIANPLIQGWANEGNVGRAKAIYDHIGREKREPSTYEAMVRGFLFAGDRTSAVSVAKEMMSRGYPPAVTNKIAELVGCLS
ncbi:hypothetical protein N7492_010448 [Penicillium capsulatum]|uniref:Pentatricopeptide repeat protein n=1 Tax=Penicillium capsulatum TaxID=69766 RepID=A0A9W9LF49_9EURO|nr:hypothetical protein N7492_010448 [Penicillium capsulatum]